MRVERVGSETEDRVRGQLLALASAWGRSLGLRWSNADRETKLYWAALALSLGLGVFLRLNGFIRHQPSFWLDEALWAPRFVNWPLDKLGIRPIGFVLLTRWVVTHFDASEFWFRFIPNLSGLLSLSLLPYVASRLLESRVLRVLLVLLFAIHPALVDLSKEFKPYTFEVLVHLVTLVLYLRYQQTRKAGYLYALLAYLPFAFVVAYNVAFALPGLLLLTLWQGYRRRSWALVLASVLGAAVCAGAVYEVSSRLLQGVERGGRTEEYWGKKYDVFYSPNDGSRARWMLEKAGDMLGMVGLRRELWMDNERLPQPAGERLGALDRWLWIALGVLGMAALLRKDRERALLLLGPLLVLTCVNALGKWPAGQFRTNLFACAYLLPLPLLGVQLARSLFGRRYEGLLLGLVAVDALGGFAVTFDPQGHKRMWCQEAYSREIIEALFDLRQQELKANPSARPARLVLDLFAHKPLDYYLGLHPQLSQRNAEFRHEFRLDKVASNRLTEIAKFRLRGAGLVYAVASKHSSAVDLKRLMAENPRLVVRHKVLAENVLIAVLDR